LLVTLIKEHDDDGMRLEQLATEETLHLLFDKHDKTLSEGDNPSVHVVVGLLNAALRVHKPCLLLLYQHQHVRYSWVEQGLTSHQTHYSGRCAL